MRSNKSARPTQESLLESLLKMVWSWSENKKYTQGLEQDSIYKPNARATTLELVSVEVLVKVECLQRFCGWEDRGCSEGCWGNIVRLKRLIELSTISSISHQRATNSKTELFWLKPSSRKRLKRLRQISLKLSKTLEDKKICSWERRGQRSNKRTDQIFKIIFVINSHMVYFFVHFKIWTNEILWS